LKRESFYCYEDNMIEDTTREDWQQRAIAFLKTVSPFDTLSDEEYSMLSKTLTEKVFREGTIIFGQGKTAIEGLYLIKSGSVKLYLKDEHGTEMLKEYRGKKDYFGALGMIMGTKANLNVEAAEDTRCIVVPKKNFLALLHTNPLFSVFYLKSFCKKYIQSAHLELHKKRESTKAEGAFYLFSEDVGSVMKKRPRMCLPDDTAQAAAEKMAKYRIGSLLVKSESGNIEGIVTDKDLRAKLIAKGLSSIEPVRSIMSSPVETIPSQAPCFDALFLMLQKGIHHLAVQRAGNIVGIVTAHDILLLEGHSPVFLFREISAQTQIEGLYSLPKQFPRLAKTMIKEGVRANNITRMITVLNDRILDRILGLLIDEMGLPPVPFCWLVMGSEGRKEQTFSTDQDNAIIYEDADDVRQKEAARKYFLALGKKTVAHLAECGYTLCKGDIMASNPKWTQPLSEWRKIFDHWIFSPDPEDILNSTIFFDFRPAFGKAKLANELRNHLVKRTTREKVFIHHLARHCAEARPPLSMFKNFVVEKNGEHKGCLDIKTKGLAPFVNFARLMCLDRGLVETNTLERIESLRQHEAISDEFAFKLREAYEFQMHVRLLHQLERVENGKQPNNYINPSELSDMEKYTLKKAFLLVSEIQSFVGTYFHVDLG